MVSVGDDTYQTLLTGEMDHRMGMTVTGPAENVKAFRFACSSSFSPTEYWVMTALFPTNGTGSTYGPNPTGSVTMGLGQILLDGGTLEMFESNGYIIIRQLGNNTKVLVIDPETGMLMDIMNGENACGSYCYKSQQTEWACDLTESIWTNGQTILDILINGNGMIDFSQLAGNIQSGLTGLLISAMASIEASAILMDNNIQIYSLIPLLGNNVMGLCLSNAYLASEIVKNDEFRFYISERKIYIPEDTIKAGGVVSGVYGLITLAGSYIVGPFALAVYSINEFELSIRNHWLPQEYWQYLRVNPPRWSAKTFAAKNKRTNYIDYFEVPRKPNGDLDWANTIYISSTEGARIVDLTDPKLAAEINSNLDWGSNECLIPL